MSELDAVTVIRVSHGKFQFLKQSGDKTHRHSDKTGVTKSERPKHKLQAW